MSGAWPNILVNIAYPPVWAWWWNLVTRRNPAPWRLPLALGSAAIGDLIGAGLQGIWVSVGISIAYLAAAVVIFWWRRKKRDPVAKLIGAKARARRDALVRRAREVVRPRPVLKPSPVPR